jgi:hypothetical protein
MTMTMADDYDYDDDYRDGDDAQAKRHELWR